MSMLPRIRRSSEPSDFSNYISDLTLKKRKFTRDLITICDIPENETVGKKAKPETHQLILLRKHNSRKK